MKEWRKLNFASRNAGDAGGAVLRMRLAKQSKPTSVWVLGYK
jgi:hypothetical protein